MIKSPLLSIVIPTYNNEHDLQNIFSYLLKQSFPKKLTEYIVADGGSKDKTLVIAKKYKARVVQNPDRLAEPGIFHGMSHARGEIVMVLAVDNIFEDIGALQNMVNVFDDKKVYAAFPKHMSTRDDNLFTKYVNTFTDPFNHFVYGRAANARTFQSIYLTLKHTDLYDIYDYASSPIAPMIAIAQGFTVRKEFVQTRTEKLDDLISVMQIIRKRKHIAYVHGVDVFHHTIRDMDHFIRKQQWATKNALEKKQYGIALRREKLSVGQKARISLYPIYSFSIIFPIVYSVVNAVRDRELMWLFHPVINTICALAIAKQIFIMKLGFSKSISRQ